MRNILIFLLLLFSISCSSPFGDGTIEPDNKTYFHPPTWIQGVWINEGNSYYNMEFTKNDFVIRSVSYNERINILSTEFLNCKEEKSTNKYKVTITHLTDNITIYDFTRIAEDEVHCDYDATINGERTLEVFTLKKQ